MEKIKSFDCARGIIGILDTACYPCRYYVGFIHEVKGAGWFPNCNDTHLFHRTLTQAENEFDRMKANRL